MFVVISTSHWWSAWSIRPHPFVIFLITLISPRIPMGNNNNMGIPIGPEGIPISHPWVRTSSTSGLHIIHQKQAKYQFLIIHPMFPALVQDSLFTYGLGVFLNHGREIKPLISDHLAEWTYLPSPLSSRCIYPLSRAVTRAIRNQLGFEAPRSSRLLAPIFRARSKTLVGQRTKERQTKSVVFCVSSFACIGVVSTSLFRIHSIPAPLRLELCMPTTPMATTTKIRYLTFPVNFLVIAAWRVTWLGEKHICHSNRDSSLVLVVDLLERSPRKYVSFLSHQLKS